MSDDKPIFAPPDWACLAQAPDLLDEDGKVHVCGMVAGHSYAPEGHSDTFWHHCSCGVAFTGDSRLEDVEPATT